MGASRNCRAPVALSSDARMKAHALPYYELSFLYEGMPQPHADFTESIPQGLEVLHLPSRVGGSPITGAYHRLCQDELPDAQSEELIFGGVRGIVQNAERCLKCYSERVAVLAGSYDSCGTRRHLQPRPGVICSKWR